MSRSRLLCVALAVSLGTALLAACQPQGGGNGGSEELDVSALVGQWEESTHALIVTQAAEESFCVQCHDGGAFADGVTEPKQLDRDFPVATDCRACHTGRGEELFESGEASAPVLSEPMQAGEGAVCSGCHRSFSKPDINNKDRDTAHHSPVIDVYSAQGGIRTGDMEPGSTAEHTQVDNTCAGCHMLPTEDGFPSHTFQVTDVAEACGECHDDLKSEDTSTVPEIPAKADYDGNGETQSFQQEVAGLMTALEDAITSAMDGASYSVERGAIVFERGGTTIQPTPEIPDNAYLAIYNHYMIEQDGSQGMHNPEFTVDLLQESYEALTGKPLKNAQPFPEENDD